MSTIRYAGRLAAAALLTAAALSAQTASAAGFQLTEQSSLGAGRAYAGAGIVGDDLSAVHYNPAGMTLLPGTQMQAGSVWIEVNAEYEGNHGSSENGRYKGQAIPAGYITHQLTDDVWLGLGLTVPFGMGTDYGKGWEGKERGYTSTILTFDINPNVAWKVNDFLSVGGGISLQYAKAKLGASLRHPLLGDAGYGKINADSWDWGWNFGIMVSPTERLRLGLSYRSSITHDAEGDFDYTPSAAAATQPPHGPGLTATTFNSKATVKTPDTVMFTTTWEATDNLRLSSLIRWSKWSNFKTLTIKNEASGRYEDFGSKSYDNDWEDTWLFSVGADYKLNDAWTVRGGVAYEKDPVGDNSKRMAVIPDTDRLWLSLGATWNASKNIQIDGGFSYLKGIGNRDLYDKVGDEQPIGKYKSLDAVILGIQGQYRF